MQDLENADLEMTDQIAGLENAKPK